jgi:hypothetical protein
MRLAQKLVFPPIRQKRVARALDLFVFLRLVKNHLSQGEHNTYHMTTRSIINFITFLTTAPHIAGVLYRMSATNQ